MTLLFSLIKQHYKIFLTWYEWIAMTFIVFFLYHKRNVTTLLFFKGLGKYILIDGSSFVM